jgi:multiple antibiotic resistance protein
MDLVYQFISAFLLLFIITDPIGNLPLFLALTEKQSDARRKNTLRIAVLTGFVILLIVSLLGTGILKFFRITLTDFKVAGGALLFIIAILILIGRRWEATESEDVGAVPLGCPLLVGPGAITTTIVLIGEYGLNLTLYAIMANFVTSWVIFRFSNSLNRILGTTGSKIIAKVMAILIAAIAIKYMREGIIDIVRSSVL